ncbi:hypothetical protein HAX54_033410 [Datura stramonium]|uniref:Uncharacterized protein n=1 Tax=Datura stramonium TaxID=4076 RepID=A0ABS8VDM9_DATST|nr:hypothetical protein [Datura stramonium]
MRSDKSGWENEAAGCLGRLVWLGTRCGAGFRWGVRVEGKISGEEEEDNDIGSRRSWKREEEGRFIGERRELRSVCGGAAWQFDGSGRKWRVPIWLKKKGVVREKVRRERGYAGVVVFCRREIKEGGMAAILGVLQRSGVVGRRGEREKRGERGDNGFPAMVILFPVVGRSGRRNKKRERGPVARRREKKEKNEKCSLGFGGGG